MATLRELLDAVEKADNVNATAGAAARAAHDKLEIAKQALQDAMIEQGTDVAKKPGLTVTLKPKSRPNVQDWDAFYAFIKRYNHFQLLERRVSGKAFEEVLLSRKGKEVPGTTVFEYQQLSITRGKS